jgi:hypothetical protein
MTENHEGEDSCLGQSFSSFPGKGLYLFGSCRDVVLDVSCEGDESASDDDVPSGWKESVIEMEFRYSSD